jgi:hypothetical protein
MDRWRIVAPSPRRLIGSLLLVAALTAVAAGTALYVLAVVTRHDPAPVPIGDHLRLLVLDLMLWGPAALMTLWYISLPAIALLGTAAAVIRRA